MSEAARSRSAVGALLARHGLVPRKRLGQHFLVDPNIVDRIVRLIEAPPGTTVLEVGAGTGVLTLALAEAGYPVVAYEIDPVLEPVLREVIGGRDDVELRMEDASNAVLDRPGPWVLAANLPYNMGTPILLDIVRKEGSVIEFVVMVQREMADRITARPGSKEYGVPSVVAQLFCDVRRAFTVPPQVFLPPPRVGSAVVRMVRNRPPAPIPERASELAGAAFSQRRKMLRSSLRDELPVLDRVCEIAGVEPSWRAEDLSPGDYLALADAEAQVD